MDHGITTRCTGAEDVESRQAAKLISVVEHVVNHVDVEQLLSSSSTCSKIVLVPRLVVGSSWLVGGSSWLIQVLQVQHLQGIHTCREEASQAGLLGLRVATG